MYWSGIAMTRLYQGLIIVCLASLMACGSTLTAENRASIRTVGVVNKFPEFPKYIYVGTTLLQHESQEVNDLYLKDFITDQITSLLIANGYAVMEVSENEQDSEVDLVMTITPSDIYEMINANGYGFYQASTFGVVRSEASYVSLNLLPAIPGKTNFGPFYGQSLTELAIEDMPEAWSELQDDKKLELVEVLKSDIVRAVKVAFDKTGL